MMNRKHYEVLAKAYVDNYKRDRDIMVSLEQHGMTYEDYNNPMVFVTEKILSDINPNLLDILFEFADNDSVELTVDGEVKELTTISEILDIFME